MKEVTKTCSGCGGPGTNPGTLDPDDGDPQPTETTCLKCDGGGRLPLGELSDDLMDFLADLANKVDDILEKVSE